MKLAPEDYIDVNTLPKVPKRQISSVRSAVRDTVKRFYNQEFNARDIYEVMARSVKWDRRQGLYAYVRHEVRHLVKTKEIEIVHQGKPGWGDPSIFRNP